MNDPKPPIRFDFRAFLSTARRKLNTRVGDVTLNLPFLSINVNPDDLEQSVAREIIIRLADRRVLNAKECCDNCIDNALESLQGIRATLVDMQVRLTKATDGPLYLLTELMLGGIRQFITFTEDLKDAESNSKLIVPSDFRRPPESRETEFAALEVIRAHLYRCMSQVAKIADVGMPTISEGMRYDDAWQIEAHEEPKQLETH